MDEYETQSAVNTYSSGTQTGHEWGFHISKEE